jgi:hypothetical protein
MKMEAINSSETSVAFSGLHGVSSQKILFRNNITCNPSLKLANLLIRPFPSNTLWFCHLTTKGKEMEAVCRRKGILYTMMYGVR